MNSIFFKGLLAVVIGCIASLVSVKDAGPLYWLITIAGVVLTYYGQHAVFKPISVFGTIDLMDILKGIMMAIGTAISTFIASLAGPGKLINLHDLLIAVASATLAYLTKNLFSNQQGILGK